jgi:hypothetical protein
LTPDRPPRTEPLGLFDFGDWDHPFAVAALTLALTFLGALVVKVVFF